MSLPEGINGVLFDCYNTLIDIRTDENTLESYSILSRWLIYHGVEIEPGTLRDEYRRICRKRMKKRGELYPEIKIEKVFRDICHQFRIWEIDEKRVGKEAARLFRAASVQHRRVIPESRRLLEYIGDIPTGVVSNGQRAFSEQELKHVGLHHFFDVIVYSSDYGMKKPDPRLYYKALDKLGLGPEEVLFVGDSYENDVLGPRRIGMRSLFIHDAWRIPDGC